MTSTTKPGVSSQARLEENVHGSLPESGRGAPQPPHSYLRKTSPFSLPAGNLREFPVDERLEEPDGEALPHEIAVRRRAREHRQGAQREAHGRLIPGRVGQSFRGKRRPAEWAGRPGFDHGEWLEVTIRWIAGTRSVEGIVRLSSPCRLQARLPSRPADREPLDADRGLAHAHRDALPFLAAGADARDRAPCRFRSS